MTPPDTQAKLDAMRFRAHTMELTVHKIRDDLSRLLNNVDLILRQIKNIEDKHPLALESVGESMQIAVDAVRHLPQFAGKSDDVIAKQLGGGV